MNVIAKALFVAAVLAMTAGTASAAVVCNDEGDCWRVRGRPTYGPSEERRTQGPRTKRLRQDRRLWHREPSSDNRVAYRYKKDWFR
jgi:hypothetical protein